MRVIFACFLLLLCGSHVLAQKHYVYLRFQDSRRQPVEFVAVYLNADSTKKMGNITDSSGWTSFITDSAGAYRLKATATGYQTIDQKLHINSERDTFFITLQPSGTVLKEVVVQTTRPLMRQEEDKTIVDPEQLAAASSNSYEVLEKTPGLFIDQDGNIYLSSVTPATVYINGRELKMSRSDIAAILKNLPPSSIEKIEIMRTPSAKYDASGSGGIVNVVLKKGVKIGLNGSVNAGAQQGVNGNQYAGLNLSNNNGGTTSYLNINVSRQNNYQQLNTDRVLGVDTVLSQKAYTTYPGNNIFTGFGLGKDLDSNWNLSYDARLSYTDGSNTTDNSNDILVARKVAGTTRSAVTNDNRSFVASQELSSVFKIDTSGSEWRNNLSYTYSDGRSGQEYQNSSALYNTVGAGSIETIRHYGVLQSDLSYHLPHRITMEAGVKSGYLSFRNDAAYTIGSGAYIQTDFTRSNRYTYTENINAAYLQGAKTFGGFILKTGVRLENTNMSGRQTVPGDTSFAIHRTDAFPYVYFSKKVIAIAGYDLRAYLVYRRTISRPSYEQLNPFPKYVDQFMSEIGNPSLRPQFTHNYEFNVSVDEHPLLAVGYNDTRDMFTNVFYQADSTRSQAYRGYDNIGSNREYYLKGFAAVPPGKAYFGVIGGQFNYNTYDGLYEGKPLHFSGRSWLFYTYHQLKLGKRSVFTLNGFWRLAGPLQFYELSAMGSLNASINRKFFHDKLTVTLNVTDMFYSNNNNFIVRQGSVNASGYRASDSRRVGLNLRYNFGLRKKEDEPGMFDVNADSKK